MSVLEDLPSCPIWRIHPMLVERGLSWHMCSAREDSDGELALVSRRARGDGDTGAANGDRDDRCEMGIAVLVAGSFVVTMCKTHRELIAAYGGALKRLGWRSADPAFARAVYGEAN